MATTQIDGSQIKTTAFTAGANMAINFAANTFTFAAAGSGISGSGTNGQVTFWTGASAISGDNNLFWDNTNKVLGIGTNTPNIAKVLTVQGDVQFGDVLAINSPKISIAETVTAIVSRNGLFTNLIINPTADSTQIYIGMNFLVQNIGAVHNSGTMRGLAGTVLASAAGTTTTNATAGRFVASGNNGTVTTLNGADILATTQAAATIPTINGTNVNLTLNATTTNAYGIHINTFGGSGAATTNAYGLKVEAPGQGIAQWTMAIETGNSYVAGSLNVGSSATAATEKLEVHGTSRVTGGRFLTAKGADVVAANNLTLGTDGNVFNITGNTQVNAITTTGWPAGSMITLIFTGTPTVKQNTAGGAGTSPLLLAGSVDFSAAANSVLGFVFDGTQWQECWRKVA